MNPKIQPVDVDVISYVTAVCLDFYHVHCLLCMATVELMQEPMIMRT